jgi:hypothetical protein
MARTQIDIDDSPFRRSHMTSPKGRGSWAFAMEPNPRDVCKDVQFTPGGMLYGEAKRWIKQWFRDQQAAGKFPLLHGASYVVIYAQP